MLANAENKQYFRTHSVRSVGRLPVLGKGKRWSFHFTERFLSAEESFSYPWRQVVLVTLRKRARKTDTLATGRKLSPRSTGRIPLETHLRLTLNSAWPVAHFFPRRPRNESEGQVKLFLKRKDACVLPLTKRKDAPSAKRNVLPALP